MMKKITATLLILASVLLVKAIPRTEPDLMIYTKDEVEAGVDNVLICHVHGFYPAPVHVTWTRNNVKLTRDITDTVPQLHKDGTFYQFSRLKFTPEEGDIYSCSADHQTLSSPLIRMWDVVEVDQPSVIPDVICGAGLSVGLVGVALGTFFLIKGNECN